MSTISEAHANAARANGAKSQGPITEEGKARSSHNATTHGLTAQTVMIEPDQMDEYLASIKEHFEFICPSGPIENTLCKRMIDAMWNIRRAGMLEVKLKEKAGEDPLITSDRFIYRQGINLLRHKNTHTRSYDKAWKELQAMQAKRKAEEEAKRREPELKKQQEAEAEAAAIRTQLDRENLIHEMLGPDCDGEEKASRSNRKPNTR